MSAGPQFNLDHEVTYGVVDQISALVQRVTCENASKFTFKGTGTYIVGNDNVAIIDPGPPHDAHVDALLAAIDGRTVTHLLITHTHGDHSPAAELLQHHIDAPTYAFGPHPLDRPAANAAEHDEDESGFGFDPIEEDDSGSDEKKDDEDEGYKSDHAHDWDFVPDVALAHGDILAVIRRFAESASVVKAAGFSGVQIHAAHGYLINQFLSPLSNRRGDAYGGDFSHRCRFLMETIDAVRGVWPDDLPLFLRLSCTEWVEGGWDMDQSIALCRQLKARGDIDLIDCTSGGNDPRQQIPIYPGYQVRLAETIRRETGLATSAVGLLHSPDLAEEIVANGRADLVALGRALMADPHWPLQAAKALRATNLEWPIQYERSNIY
jgi:hypothetical protein